MQLNKIDFNFFSDIETPPPLPTSTLISLAYVTVLAIVRLREGNADGLQSQLQRIAVQIVGEASASTKYLGGLDI